MRIPFIAFAGIVSTACVAGQVAKPPQSATAVVRTSATDARPAAAAKPSPVAAPAPVLVATALPEGPGKDRLVSNCSACHESTIVVGQRRDLAEWNELIDSMIARGASVSDDDHSAIAKYLAQNFGKPTSGKN